MEPFRQQFAQRMPERAEEQTPEHTPPRFDAETRARLYDLLRWR